MAEYFKSIEVDPKEFYFVKIETEIKDDMKELSKSKYEMWLEEFAIGKVGKVEYYSKECYNKFKTYCDDSKMAINEVNNIKFGIYISKLEGVEKKRKEKGMTYIFDFDKINMSLQE